MCPSCLVLHRGPVQVCAYCDELENDDDEDDYDYVEDDRNYDAGRDGH